MIHLLSTLFTGLFKLISPVFFLFAGAKIEENNSLKKKDKRNDKIHDTRNRIRFDDNYRERVRDKFNKK